MGIHVFQGHFEDWKEGEVYPLRLTRKRAKKDCQDDQPDKIKWEKAGRDENGFKLLRGTTKYCRYYVHEIEVTDD